MENLDSKNMYMRNTIKVFKRDRERKRKLERILEEEERGMKKEDNT